MTEVYRIRKDSWRVRMRTRNAERPAELDPGSDFRPNIKSKVDTMDDKDKVYTQARVFNTKNTKEKRDRRDSTPPRELTLRCSSGASIF